MGVESQLLRLENVSKDYADAGGRSLSILRGIGFTIQNGETVAIVGPSGSGKSTLLNIIGGLDRPTSGSVHLAGRDLSGLTDKELARVRNREIGFIFQAHHLLPQCTVLENVLVPCIPAGTANKSETVERAKGLLKRVGLADREDHRPGQLSGGERQRVAVVRALINGPKLLLADEPTGALDRSSAENLAALLIEINREQNLALIVVTHAVDLAGKMSRKLELRDGQLVQSAL
jgi:lipoprotein-releasing system ATP-binding protein